MLYAFIFFTFLACRTIQWGPCNHTIGGQTICFKDEQSPDFKNYQKLVCVNVAFQHWLELGVNHFRPITFLHTIVQVVANCIALANRLIEHGYKLVSGGNDNHMVLVHLR